MSGGCQTSVVAAPRDRAVEARRSGDGAARATIAQDAGGRGWSPGAPSDPAAAAGARHAFGEMRIHPQPQLAIGKPDDAYEIEAERAADRALAGATVGGASSSSATPPVQARAAPGSIPTVTPELPRQIESAATEARPLPTEQRTFYEQRLGHDFGAVRIHAGPAAAEAAASAGAQAFTRGQQIYFGENYYRPEQASGQWLMAHELAHTVQQRPNVIARRALDQPSETGATTTLGKKTPPEHAVESAPGDASQALVSGPPDDSTPAPIAPPAEVATAPPKQAGMLAATTAATKMQAVVQSATRDTEQGPEGAGGTEDGSTAQAPGIASPAAAAETAGAAQTAMATFDSHLAEVSSRRSADVRFQDVEPGSVESLEDRLQRGQSTSLAKTFLDGIGQQVETIVAAAKGVPSQLLTSLVGATGEIGAAAKAQTATLHDSAETARRQVRAQSSRTRGLVENKRKESDQTTGQTTRSAQDQATAARNKANSEIGKQAGAQEKVISTSFSLAVPRMMMVGIDAGKDAKAVARRKADAWLDQRNGESSVLDGPIHDNRIEAAADAAISVSEEYAASFQKSANEQAFKIPENKPEVLGKVAEITGQTKKGLDDQLTQVNDGATAFIQSAAARTAKVGTGFKSSAAASATQTAVALSAAEEQQVGEIASFSDMQCKSLDQSVASSLGALTDGVDQSVGALTQSMGDFVASAASEAPPEPEQLAPQLEDVKGQTAASASTMGEQVQGIGPTMDTAITTGRDQSVQMITGVATNAGKMLGDTNESFSKGARALNQQASSGFDKLGKGDRKTAEAIGTDAAAGFVEAAKNTAASFGQFGQTVDENFALGRTQVLSSLWGTETKARFGKDMRDYGKQAADKVQPRWKKVLKWVITIVVIIAVIAITVATAGALGPVGVILLGAALGAAAGAVTTIAHNLIDEKPWSEGVAKAMIAGAIGGAVGGAGGLLLKGVGSFVVKTGLDAGINMVGGFAGEAIGSVATGESFSWTNAVTAGLVAGGFSLGLGIAGAIKGKIRIPGFEPSPPPQARPQVEAPQPSGRVRSLLEQAKILAPRAGSVPEPGVGGLPKTAPKPEPRVDVEPAPVSETKPISTESKPTVDTEPKPAIDTEPKPAIDTEPKPAVETEPKPAVDTEPKPAVDTEPKPAVDTEPKPAVDTEPKPAVDTEPKPAVDTELKPNNPIGFKPKSILEAQAAANAEPKPGFKSKATGETPTTVGAAKKDPIGFKTKSTLDAQNAANTEPQLTGGKTKPRRLIGYGRENEFATQESTVAGKPRRQIGFGNENVFIDEPPVSSQTSEGGSFTDLRGQPLEGGQSFGEPTTGGGPSRIGGRSNMEVNASAGGGEKTSPVKSGRGSVEQTPVEQAPTLEQPGISKPVKPTEQVELTENAETAKSSEPAKQESATEPEATKSPDEPVSKKSSLEEQASKLQKKADAFKNRRDAANDKVKELYEKIERAKASQERAREQGLAATKKKDAVAAQAAYDKIQRAKAQLAEAYKELPNAELDARIRQREYGEVVREQELLNLRLNPETRSEMPCFSADTVVWSATGPKPIHAIVRGDMVRAFDHSSRTTVLRKVKAAFTNKTVHFYDITVGGETIRATGQHRFWLADDVDWIPANQLKVGAHLQHWDGSRREIQQIVYRDIPEQPTYNLSIDELPNYFVGAGVLVHNGTPANYAFGGYVIYEGTNPNPEFAGKLYIGLTDDITGRQGEHRAEAIRNLQRTDLSPKERAFWEFKRDMVLKERITGLNKDQAMYFEQKNIDIELKLNEENVMNRKHVEVSEERMAQLEKSIANDPAVLEAKFCLK